MRSGNAEQQPEDDHTSQSLGRQLTVLQAYGYKILTMLGEGSYGTVKLAYSTRHQTNVAVKIISKQRVKKEYMDKFLPREISIIKNPN